MTIIERLLRTLVSVAMAKEEEICGFLLCSEGAGRSSSQQAVVSLPIPNISPTPKTGYIFDPASSQLVLEIWGDRIVGTYHSHPGREPWTTAQPSFEDTVMLLRTKLPMAIIKPQASEIRVFEAVSERQITETAVYRLDASLNLAYISELQRSPA